jgi:hypothetical protein
MEPIVRKVDDERVGGMRIFSRRINPQPVGWNPFSYRLGLLGIASDDFEVRIGARVVMVSHAAFNP